MCLLKEFQDVASLEMIRFWKVAIQENVIKFL